LTPLSEFTRAVQVERMLEWVDTFSAFDRHPVVLTGDFNTREGSPVYAAVATRGFVDTFRAANLAAGGFTSSQDITAAAATVRSRIDYVFARGAVCTSRHGARTGALPEVTSSAVLGDAPSPVGAGFLWPSDHYGVVSALKPFPATPGTCHAPGLRR
jgi:endonuclease/exonuclease/phosphatase family metal-dependent hydrolase